MTSYAVRSSTLLAVLLLPFPVAAAPAEGPLRFHPDNPRYLTAGGGGRAVYLTGSHNWYNLQDAGRIGKPLSKEQDYDGYLALLSENGHNFIRLWTWEGAGYWWQGRATGEEYYEPLPYRRTGRVTRGTGSPSST